MNSEWKTSLWKQFGAAIDMLADSIRLCPEQLWTVALWKNPEDERYGQFWFVAYHALRWLDVFLAGTKQGFVPPAPFLPKGLPEQPYPKEQLLAYLQACRAKCQAAIEGMTDEKAGQRCVFDWMEVSYLELQMYSMRHVQEHAAQLSLELGKHDVVGMDWVASAREA